MVEALLKSTKISVQIPFVIPAKAGIQAILLDSGQKHAGMTTCGNGHFILWNSIRSSSMKVAQFDDGEKNAPRQGRED